MILRPLLDDYKVVGFYTAKVMIGIALGMLIPFALCLACRQWTPAVDFLIGLIISLILAFILNILCFTNKELGTGHAMVVGSVSWLVAMFLGAIPLHLSGHFGSYLDACFESMSGFATTGLTLVRDVDHMSLGVNLWRHLIIFMGGQGIVVIALTFLFRGVGGAFRAYLGEARDEQIMPNVVETARFIWAVSFVYMAVGTLCLWLVTLCEGIPPLSGLFQSACIFMAAWDTGGFTPHLQNILYYHSRPFELVTTVIMILGSMNFALHYALWTGKRHELFRNIETRTFLASVAVLFCLVAFVLLRSGIYSHNVSVFSRGFYQLISAHTTTGFSNIAGNQFVTEWGQLGMFCLTLAMAIGGSVCSSAGAIKVLRLGILFKALKQDVKRLIMPEHAVVVQKIHHIKDLILEDKYVRAAVLIMLLYVGLYIAGAIVGMVFGYSFDQALFESVSAAGNVGLSCGITAPSMPAAMKVTYIIQMWAGRLEFISIFVLGGFIFSIVRGRK